MAEAHNIQEEVKKYFKVYYALLVLTVITVAIVNLKVGIVTAIVLALIIATFKASLVASIFMHLMAERKLIYLIMGLTLFFFISMLILIGIGYKDDIVGQQESIYAVKAQEAAVKKSGHDTHHSEETSDEHHEPLAEHH